MSVRRRNTVLEYGSYESVAPARYGLNETRFFRIVFEDLADFTNGGIDALVGVHQLAAVLDEESEKLHRDAFKHLLPICEDSRSICWPCASPLTGNKPRSPCAILAS